LLPACIFNRASRRKFSLLQEHDSAPVILAE
jgi:hypothetical protein